MSKKNVNWLYEELPGLVSSGILSAESAEKLLQHYKESKNGGLNLAIVSFSIIGAVLMGFGIILILAHNWDQLLRPVRAMLSFAPLIMAQVLAGFVLLKRRESTGWCEGAGTFWVLAIGASIALVAQTYHISGDFGVFILTWSLMALPVVYLLNSSVAALLFWIGTTVWVSDTHGQHGTEVWFWPMLGLAVPHLLWAFQRNRYHVRVGALNWVLTICGAFGIWFALGRYSSGDWIPVYTGYFALVYMLGSLWFEEGRMFWQRSFQTVGGLGVIVLSIVLSFENVWHYQNPMELLNITSSNWVQTLSLLVWPMAALGLWGYLWRKRELVTLLFGALPVIAIAGVLLSGNHLDFMAMMLMNVYVLALSVALIWLGTYNRLNIGMLILLTLIIVRFFDSDLGFVVKGLAFITAGVGFLVTNVMLIRKTQGAK